jgi:hypothetical protein
MATLYALNVRRSAECMEGDMLAHSWDVRPRRRWHAASASGTGYIRLRASTHAHTHTHRKRHEPVDGTATRAHFERALRLHDPVLRPVRCTGGFSCRVCNGQKCRAGRGPRARMPLCLCPV